MSGPDLGLEDWARGQLTHFFSRRKQKTGHIFLREMSGDPFCASNLMVFEVDVVATISMLRLRLSSRRDGEGVATPSGAEPEPGHA